MVKGGDNMRSYAADVKELVAVRALAALDANNFELLCYVKPIKPFNRTRKTTVVI